MDHRSFSMSLLCTRQTDIKNQRHLFHICLSKWYTSLFTDSTSPLDIIEGVFSRSTLTSYLPRLPCYQTERKKHVNAQL